VSGRRESGRSRIVSLGGALELTKAVHTVRLALGGAL
jgi:hypothetical protein